MIIFFYGLGIGEIYTQSIENYYEEVIGRSENPESFSEEIIEKIELLRQNPIPLIGTSANELAKIPTISKQEAKDIVKYINSHETISIHNIASELSLSITQELLLSECTTLSEYGVNYRKSLFEYRLRNMNYLSPVYGLEEDKFVGNSLNIYQRAKFHKNNFSGSFLLDKDTGEEKINDFMSGNISYNKGNFKLLIGDYSLNIGMGNVLWKAFGMSKGMNVIDPVIQIGDGFKPYTSSMDYQFFRGIAGSYKIKISDYTSLKTSIWVSNINRNARIDTVENIAKSIYKSGYYRTKNEISKKGTLNERVMGGEVHLSSENYKSGLSAVYFDYEYPIESSSSSAFRGKSGTLLTAYGGYDFENVSLFSEISRDARGNFSEKIAYQYFGNKFKLAGHFRNYPEEYRAQNGYNFGEFSYAANEIGLYTGLFFKPTTWLEEAIYIDIFKSHGETYYVPEAVKGVEYFTETVFKLPNKNKLSVRIKSECKTDSYDRQTYIYYRTKNSARIEWRKDFSNSLYLRLRGESCIVDFENVRLSEQGFLFFVEAGWRMNKYLKFNSRINIFDTQSYESAIWTYEYTFPGMMYSPALYGEGWRFYFGSEFNLTDKINSYVRYIFTYKPNEDNLGSGYLRILDNQDHRVYLQLDFKI